MTRLLRALTLVAATASLAGCGYTLAGRGNTLPTHIRTIGVPQCVNHSSTPDIDGVLTDKVRQELTSRGRYLINPGIEGADATLTCTVVAVTIIPIEFGADRLPIRQAIVVTASIEFKDVKDDKVLYSNPGFQARDEFSVTTSQSVNDPNSFLRTNVQAMDRLAQNFARTIVTSILEAF
jgi:Lipopolysaccharide-assembly